MSKRASMARKKLVTDSHRWVFKAGRIMHRRAAKIKVQKGEKK
jgi:hypothetical protein